VQRFMEKEGQPGEKNRPSHWFDVPEGFALECLVIGEGEQRRAYVVTTEPPAEHAWIHDRWPLLVGNRSMNPVLADGFFQEAEAEAGEQFHGSSAS